MSIACWDITGGGQTERKWEMTENRNEKKKNKKRKKLKRMKEMRESNVSVAGEQTDVYCFFLLKRLKRFSLSFSLSFSRLPGLDSVVMVTVAGSVCARLEAGVLWLLGVISDFSEDEETLPAFWMA